MTVSPSDVDFDTSLRAFDGRSVASLLPLAETAPDAARAALLEQAVRDPARSVAATWIIKALFDGNQVGALDMANVFGALEEDLPGDAILHLMQLVRRRAAAAAPQDAHVARLVDHERPLIRVWALDALARMAEAEAGLRDQVCARIEAGLEDASRAMRSRCRNLRLEYEWARG